MVGGKYSFASIDPFGDSLGVPAGQSELWDSKLASGRIDVHGTRG